MERKACNYSVVRYVSDPVRNEPRNIGIILQSRELGYINCRFLTNLSTKLAGSATTLDIKIIKNYIEEFSASFKPFKDSSLRDFFQQKTEFLKEDYLTELARHGRGKIQFSQVRGCLTDDPEKKLEYLFHTFVGEEPFRAIKRSALKLEIKNEFINNQLLVTSLDKERKRGFEFDVKIVGRAKVEHVVDFVLKNTYEQYFIETVDMRKKDKRGRAFETYETALKFDDLRHSLNENEVKTYSIVALPEEYSDNNYMKILDSYSKIVIYNDEKEKEQFLSEMRNIVAVNPNLF